MMARPLALFAPALIIPALAACQTVQSTHETSRAFAQNACGACHAVEINAISPNPDAPGFADIANREGLTESTLSVWLRDAHNYPEAMEFTLEESDVRKLVAHMLTLQREGYRPPIN